MTERRLYVALRAAALVPPPVRTRMAARWLAAAMVLFLIFALLAPWQQSVSGAGRVVAFTPIERQQVLEAPIMGRVVRWFVREGSQVAEGDPLVELVDNDPLFADRLERERQATELKLRSYDERVAMLEQQVATSVELRRTEISAAEAKFRAASEKLRSLEQKVASAEAALETALLNVDRVRALAGRGLAATRDRELAELGTAKSRAEREGAQADLLSARGDLDAARAALQKARADGDVKVQESEAKLRSARSDFADARTSLARIEVAVARQANQVVAAPRAGAIFRLLAAPGGDQVKQGDPLAILVPSTQDRAVELTVDGNDAAIVSEGRRVRLQFEGWPAVQFTGWPSVAVGTFGGVVSFIDQQDDGYGDFRMVVVPDPNDEPWPDARFLRQGVRAKGWVLLERVTIGFELWRRLNGFPPKLGKPPAVDSPMPASKGGKL